MKKIATVFLMIGMLCVFIACSSNSEDDAWSIPNTDTSKFKNGNEIFFPKGTSALEIYSTLFNIFGDGENFITAHYRHTETAVLNGNNYTDTIEKNVVLLKLYRTKTELAYSFHADFITDDDETLAFYYEWQYSNTNAWHNNKSVGEFTIFN